MRHRSIATLVLTLAVALAACGREARAADPAEVVFAGACDASGAVELTRDRMVVADDEDNVLRVYDVERGGAPVRGTDVSAQLGLPLKGKKRPAPGELDLEAATRIGDRAYWLTSHGRKKSGKLAEERLRLFATTLATDRPLEVVGRPYDGLVADLIASPALARFRLDEASRLPPKEPGGLNLEGLTAGADGRVLVGLRSPLAGTRAIVVPVLDLAALVGEGGARLEIGEPALLDLGGRGIRSLSWWRGRYLIVAGSPASGGTSALYTWDGQGAPVEVAAELAGYNPEGFFTPDDRDRVLVLSDDGERPIDGVPCKQLDDPSKKRFRGVWIDLPRGR